MRQRVHPIYTRIEVRLLFNQRLVLKHVSRVDYNYTSNTSKLTHAVATIFFSLLPSPPHAGAIVLCLLQL